MAIGLFSFYGSTYNLGMQLQPYNSIAYLKSSTSNLVQVLPSAQLDFKNYPLQFSYSVPYGETDYYTIKSYKNKDSIINNIAYINKKPKKLNLVGKPNMLQTKFKINKNSTINMPIIAYANTYLKINGKTRYFAISNRGTVQFNLKKGNYNVSVGYKAPLIYYINLIITILSWILILGFLFFKKFQHILLFIIDFLSKAI